MLVSEIPLKPFIPWQVYSQIYLISPEYLAQQQVDVARRDRYLELRHHLELELSQTNLEQLPSPEDKVKCQLLFKNKRFLCVLRKLAELKTILDEGLENQIYAQTVIELDGNITNRYHQTIVEHPQGDLLLELHTRGVEAGEKQWRGIIRFLVRIIEFLAKER